MSDVVPLLRPDERRRSQAAHPSRARRPLTPAPSGPAGGPRGPDPQRLLRLVARVFLEVEAGRRPFGQLAPLLAPALLTRLEGTVPTPGALNAPVPDPIVAIRYDEPWPGTVDAVVVVRGRPRITSLAIRIEQHRGSWRVVELARPESQGRRVRRPSWLAARDLPPSERLEARAEAGGDGQDQDRPTTGEE